MTVSIFTEKYKKFRRMLKEHREKAVLSQIALSQKLGKPNNFVNRYELGERRLDVVEFLDIAEAIGFNPLDFIKELNK